MSEEQHEVLKEQIMLYSKSIEIHAGRIVSFTKQDLDRLSFLNKEIDRILKMMDYIEENRPFHFDEALEYVKRENNSKG